jgi:nucleoside-diphosphate-sugar epimerase
MKADQEVFLVTGGMGCIGAWTLDHLQRQGKKAISFDLSSKRHRVNLLIDPEDQDTITFLQGDLTDFKQVLDAFQNHSITHVIHLAALQVPFCKADPVRGAQVNVVGTVNVFEAARHCGLNHLTYASSIAVYGPPGDYPQEFIPHDAPFSPRTLYGVYKVANESTAQIYWQDHQFSSTALRPYIVYGPARDQGLTSDPTKAMLAAVLGEPGHIGFGGRAQYHYASDVAKQFIMAALKAQEGAHGYNLGTQPATSEDIIAIIEGLKPVAEITTSETPLPFPVCDGNEYLRQFPHAEFTPLERGIRETITHFEQRN